MNKELKVESAENGFVVTYMDWTGRKRVCKSFRTLVNFMHDYFGVGKKEETKP